MADGEPVEVPMNKPSLIGACCGKWQMLLITVKASGVVMDEG